MDVSKIDKDRLFKGDKGVYLDAAIIWNETTDQYGNHGMIVQDVSKEDREAGIKGAILGNVKNIATATKESEPIEKDDLPFVWLTPILVPIGYIINLI